MWSRRAPRWLPRSARAPTRSRQRGIGDQGSARRGGGRRQLIAVSAHPRRVLADIQLYRPPGNALFPVYVRRGSLIDAVPGSALEAAYGGAGNLLDISGLAGDPANFNKAWLSN